MRKPVSLFEVLHRSFEDLAQCAMAKASRGLQRSTSRAKDTFLLKWSSLACLALAGLLLITVDVRPAYSQSNACNIAVNGSFESPDIQTEPQRPGENTAYIDGYAIWRTTTYPLDGWQTVSGTVDILRHHSNASDGMQSIDLWGTAPATLRQTFTGLNPGQQYTFSIDYAGQSSTTSIASVQLGNGNGVTPVTLTTLQPVANSVVNGGSGLPTTPYYTQTWATYQHTFTAAGTEATIQFVNNAAPGPGNTGLFIDNFTFASADPCADLAITKDDGATTFTRGSVVTYTIIVSNDGLDDAPGATISDPLPVGISTANWTCGSATGGAVCGAASGTGAINTTADLPAGSSLTYTLDMTVPADYPGVQLINTATVTVPAGFIDPDTSNNTASDTNAVSPPQPSFGSCTSTMYLSIGGNPVQLVSVDTSTNPFAFPPIGAPYSGNYNAIGYNLNDNYIYSAVWNAGESRHHLLRIGGDGSVVDLGVITGGGINVADQGSFIAGVVGPDGFYYVGGANRLYRIDLTTLMATLIPLDRTLSVADFAWHDGLIYAHDNSDGFLYSINPVTGAVNQTGFSGILSPEAFGSLVSASNGVFGRLNSGGFYRFDLTTGAATLISSSPSGAGDGAKCPTTAVTLPSDLAITKTDNSSVYSPGTNVTYTIVVSNDGPFGVQGATISDPLPAGITTANWTCVGAGGGVCGLASGIGAINTTANLPVGGTVTYTLTMGVPSSGFTGDLVNTATVTNPPDSPDPDASNNTSTDTNSQAAPALTIEKTGTLNDLDGDGLIDLGETISYSFLVTNTGDVTMAGVTVNDSLVAIDQGPQTMAPGGSFTFTATYTPTQADIDAGVVVNTATGTGTDPGGTPINSDPDEATVPPEQTPGLTVDKTGMLNDVDGDGLIDLGETITYTFLVTNTGTVTMTGVTVDDPLLNDAGISVSPGPQTLGPGGSATFTATYQPTQADIDSGSVVNEATGTGTPPSGPPIESPPDEVTVPPEQTPGLTIVKTGTLNDLDGDGLIDLGETISYSFLATNTGTVTLTGVAIEDPLVAVDQGPQTLAPNASFTFTATYRPTQADIDYGSVTNTASGTGTDPDGNTIDSPPDTVTVPPDRTPALLVDKTGTLNDLDGDGLIDLGETITYAFRVTNNGTLTMTGVTVDDPLLTDNGLAVTPGPQTLAPGGSVTFTATYAPDQADIDAGSVTNTASASGTDPDGDTSTSPPDSVTVPPEQTPGLTVDKTGTLNDLDGDDLIDLGETISYTFRVTNTGSVTMTDVTVDDPLLVRNGISVTPGPVTLGPGGSVTFTATYAPNQDDIDAGSVTNTARGTGTDPGGDTFEGPPDTVTVPPDQAPALTVDKTGTLDDRDGDGLIDLGETIDYTFIVTNSGQVTMTNVTVNDPLLDDAGVSVTPGPQTLAPGASATFTATYEPTQADIDSGSVANTATGAGEGPGGNPIEGPPDTVTVPPDAPHLTLQKIGRFSDVDGNGHASVGDTLIYTFIANNDGAQTVEDVWPQDPGPTFNGRPAGGAMSQFTPGPIDLGPGRFATFTATYTLTEDDIVNAAAVPDGIANSATLSGVAGGGVVTSDGSTSIITLPAAAPGEITVTKVAELRRIYRGQQAPFTIRVTNNSPTTATDITVVDTMPSGFRYVDGSASVDGVEATPEVAGLRVRFTGLTIPGNGEMVIRLRMLALSSAGPGEHVNRASATDAAGNTVSNEGRATVEIMAEPVFDCGDIIGKVFDDKNRNGYQDEGEPGLPGVRVATVNGWLVTTDAHGRFHVACAALPDQRIGSNFIMKVDTRTLPTGYRLTTENPRVVRLTAGKMTELNFGASIGRVVRLDLQDAAFEPGRVELREQWAEGLDQLMAFLAEEQSVLRLTYLDPGGDIELAEDRLEHLADIIGDRWRQTSGQYRLEIEMRVETGL